MHLTYEYGVRKLWIVNVGDLKPMEYPITFFLDMAWNPDKFNAQNLQQHAEEFCARQFGCTYAKEAARILSLYAKYNRRVTPEMLNAKTYSFNYGEWERVVNEYNTLALDAHKLGFLLPPEYRDSLQTSLFRSRFKHVQTYIICITPKPRTKRWQPKKIRKQITGRIKWYPVFNATPS